MVALGSVSGVGDCLVLYSFSRSLSFAFTSAILLSQSRGLHEFPSLIVSLCLSYVVWWSRNLHLVFVWSLVSVAFVVVVWVAS